jgi:hypothetical protein
VNKCVFDVSGRDLLDATQSTYLSYLVKVWRITFPIFWLTTISDGEPWASVMSRMPVPPTIHLETTESPSSPQQVMFLSDHPTYTRMYVNRGRYMTTLVSELHRSI